MRHDLKYRLAATAALLIAPPALAQQPPPDDRDVIVVTGSATPTALEKIGSALTLTYADLIEDQGYSYVADVLRQAPGLAVSRTGGFGSLTQVRIRGAEANHTLVLLDGIDVSSPDQGETDFATLLSGDVARIEVLRGPQSGLYGSNALAGVVNLITRRAVKGTYLNASVEAGEFRTIQLQGNAGAGNGADYVSVGFQALTTDGYDVSHDTAAAGFGSVGSGASPGESEGNTIATAYLRGGKEITPVFRLDGVARFLDKDSELDGQAYNFPIAGRSYDDASATSHRQYLLGASATMSLLDGRWQTVLSGSYIDEERASTSTSFPFYNGPTLPQGAGGDIAAVTLDQSGARASRTKFTLQSNFDFDALGIISNLTGFVEGKEETYQNACPAFCTAQQIPEHERTLVGLGLQYRAEIADQLFLSATVRRDDSDDFEDAETYSIAASWVVPRVGIRPHASFGAGVTNPTFFEQFGFNPGSFAGNPNLKPEKAEGWDIGVEQAFWNGRALIDLTYFESTLENEIFTAFGPPPNFPSTPANRTTQSDRSGWEAAVRLLPTDDIDLVGSFTSLNAVEPAGIEIRRPERQAALDASWRVGQGPLQLNLGITYVGAQTDTDFGTFLATGMDAYTLFRIGASYQVNERIEVYGRIENATDEEYEEIISYLGAPRAVYVGVRFKDDRSK